MVIDGSDEMVVETLRRLRESDKIAETKKAWGCGVAVVSALGAGGVMFAELTDPTIPLVVLGGLALVATIFWGLANEDDIDDYRYEALFRLHRFLSGDCDAQTNYHYEMDLRDYTDNAFLDQSRSETPGFFSGCGTYNSFFEMPVVEARVKLRDGTALQARATRTTRQRTRTRRNARGKTKTKVKYKYLDKFQINLKLPAGSPEPPAQSAHSGGGTLFSQVPPRYKADGRKVSTSFSTKKSEGSFNCDVLLRLATWTFRQIQSTPR